MSENSKGRFINGRWTAAHGGAFEVHNPAHPDQVVSSWTASSPTDVEEALRAAGEAFHDWRGVPVFERHTALNAFAAAIEARLQDIAQAITLEQGTAGGPLRFHSMFTALRCCLHGSSPRFPKLGDQASPGRDRCGYTLELSHSDADA